MTLQMGPWLSLSELAEVIREGAARAATERLMATLGPSGVVESGRTADGFYATAFVGGRYVAIGFGETRHEAIDQARAQLAVSA